MSEIKDNNRKKIVLAMKEAMEMMEGEKFTIRKVDFYHPWYTFFGDNHWTANAFFIENDHYKRWLDNWVDNIAIDPDLWPPKSYTPDKSSIRYNGVARWFRKNEDGFKSMIICYNVFTRSVTKYKKYYPYLGKLVSALGRLNNSQYVDKAIEETKNAVKQATANRDLKESPVVEEIDTTIRIRR